MPNQCSKKFCLWRVTPILRNIRNKKLGEANQRCSTLVALWNHLQGFAKPPNVWQGGAAQGQWVSELPVIPQPTGGRAGTGAQVSWHWKRTLWVMSQVREVQVTPPSHEADVVWRCWSLQGFPVAIWTGHGGDGISQRVQFRVCLRWCWSRGLTLWGTDRIWSHGEVSEVFLLIKGNTWPLKKKEKKERKAVPWHTEQSTKQERIPYLLSALLLASCVSLGKLLNLFFSLSLFEKLGWS